MSLYEELKNIRESHNYDNEEKDAFESFLDNKINADYDNVKKLLTHEAIVSRHESSICIKRRYHVESEHLDNMVVFFGNSTYVRDYTDKLSRELYKRFIITLSEYPSIDDLLYMLDSDYKPEELYIDVEYTVYF